MPKQTQYKPIADPAFRGRNQTQFQRLKNAAKSEKEKAHLRIERVIYDHLCEFVAMEKAKRMCNFAQAANHAGRMVELQDKMNKISPFLGWHPYAVYDCEWEKKRMEKALAKTHGPEGTLLAALPENARFRTDPFDDGLYECWQDLPANTPEWKKTKISSGWDAQGLHDKKGRPYKGIAWYKFDVKVPADIMYLISGERLIFFMKILKKIVFNVLWPKQRICQKYYYNTANRFSFLLQI